MVVAVQMFSLVPFRPPRGESKIVGYNALFLGVTFACMALIQVPTITSPGKAWADLSDRAGPGGGGGGNLEGIPISSGPIIIVRV